MGLVIGMMIVIIAIGLVFDRLVFTPLETWVHQRWGLASA
jgi:NitT/TauT family transport system permease protein